MIAPCRRVRHLLVIAPHPDDEAIAAWALMRSARGHGIRVDVLVVSDGAASHPRSRRWPPTRLAGERRRETRRVLRALGISPARIGFLGLRNGALHDEPRQLRRRLGRALLGRRAPDLIVGPMPDDAHPDHAAVAEALGSLPRRGERRAGYRVWPEDAARGLRDLCMPLTPQAVQMKRAAIRRYRTQAGLITDAEAGFALTHRHLRAFARPSERFAWLR